MTIKDWFSSQPVKKFRQDLLGDTRLKICKRCYDDEDLGGNSRRFKNNIKSAIFTQQAFLPSFEQSAGRPNFNASGDTDTWPVDLHIDLGNHCNLACKMCDARASSKIAAQDVKWGIESSRKHMGTDWTNNSAVWDSFKQQLLDIPGLNNIHIMGGETLLSKRFEDLVDFMTYHKRFDMSFSFVSNGTVYRPDLIKKLQKFKRVGIEISIETMDDRNTYIRQGTDTPKVLDNIAKYQKFCNGTTVDITVRPTVSSLSIGSYWQLLRYALQHQFVVKASLCSWPRMLDPVTLPTHIKQQYRQPYLDLLQELQLVNTADDYNASDHHNVEKIVKQTTEMCLQILDSDLVSDSEQQLADMVAHCARWDQVYGYSAWNLYPELNEIFQRHGYSIPS